MPRLTPQEALVAVSNALAGIVMLNGAIDKGADHPNYKPLIEATFANAEQTLNAFWASLCDDEKDPDLNDAEICLLARHKQNVAANEPPEQPDRLAKAIMARCGVML